MCTGLVTVPLLLSLAARCTPAQDIAQQAGQVSAQPAPAPSPQTSQAAPVKPSIDLYGFIEADLTHDSNSSVVGGNASGTIENSTFDLSLRATRLGFKFTGPSVVRASIGGAVEVDFNTAGSGPSSPFIRMRKAYFTMDWESSRTGLLIGQTWDVIAPLQPDTISFPTEVYTGDIGYRRPQIRLSKGFDIGGEKFLTLQTALAKTAGELVELPPATDTLAMPVVQARAAVDFPLDATHTGTIGLFGHWGTKEFRLAGPEDRVRLYSWSAGLDFLLPVSSMATLQGEAWYGAAFDLYQLGHLLSVDLRTGWHAAGGWGQLTIFPRPRLRINCGLGFDDPRDIEVSPSQRDLALTGFGNFYYDLNKHIEMGMEVSLWGAELPGDDNLTNKTRIQATFMYYF
ncbi:MAG: hypothetical protein AB1714_09220 [Acidobacteriota bacterium]